MRNILTSICLVAIPVLGLSQYEIEFMSGTNNLVQASYEVENGEIIVAIKDDYLNIEKYVTDSINPVWTEDTEVGFVIVYGEPEIGKLMIECVRFKIKEQKHYNGRSVYVLEHELKIHTRGSSEATLTIWYNEEKKVSSIELSGYVHYDLGYKGNLIVMHQ